MKLQAATVLADKRQSWRIRRISWPEGAYVHVEAGLQIYLLDDDGVETRSRTISLADMFADDWEIVL